MSKRTRKNLGVIAGASTVIAGCTAVIASAASSTGAVIGADPTSVQYPFGDYYLEPVSDSSFVPNSLYGSVSGQPGPVNTFQGTDTFNVFDADGNQIGTLDALVSHGFGPNNNLQVLVTDVLGGTPGTADGDVPAVGSVFNWAWTDATPNGFTNIYADLAGGDQAAHPGVGNVITDVGAGNLWGTWPTSMLISPFDASSHIDVHNALVRPTDFVLPNGDYVIAAPDDPETYTAVTNTAPWAVAVQGTQTFEIHHPDGTLVGTFAGNTISTADFAGGHSFEIQVLGGQTMDGGDAATSADIGDGAGQLPPDGSVFNMLYLFSPDAYNIYTDYNGTGPDGANEIAQHWNLFGLQFDATPTFDAVQNLTDGHSLFDTIPFLNGMSITPDTDSLIEYTGINGMPNGGLSGRTADVLSNQEFTLSDGDQTYNFWANVMSYADKPGRLSEALYLNPDQFSYTDLPSGLTVGPDGTAIEYTHTWLWSTLEVDPSPLDGVDGDDIMGMLYTPLGDFEI